MLLYDIVPQATVLHLNHKLTEFSCPVLSESVTTCYLIMDSDYIQLSTFRAALALTTANHALPQPVNGFATYHRFLYSFNRRTICLSVVEFK